MITPTRILVLLMSGLVLTTTAAFGAQASPEMRVGVTVVRTVQIATSAQGEVNISDRGLAVAPRVERPVTPSFSPSSVNGQDSAQNRSEQQVVVVNF